MLQLFKQLLHILIHIGQKVKRTISASQSFLTRLELGRQMPV